MSEVHRAAAFRLQVDRWTSNAVLDGIDSFDTLVCALPGVYPPIVRESLDRLLVSGVLSQSDHERALARRQTKQVVAQTSGRAAVLPPPHPLDFDWRFSADSIDLLLARAVAASSPCDSVLLLGTPSLYVAARERRVDRDFVLIDGGARTVEVLRDLYGQANVHHRDVLDHRLPKVRAAVVIADPPWYDDHVEAFMWAAASCAERGAQVFVTLPPIGTRPGVRQERSRFREIARAHSFRGPWIEAGAISYMSPPFETNALSAAGWVDLPAAWRRGDLFSLIANGAAGAPPTRFDRVPHWNERRLGCVRVRVKSIPRTASIDPTLRSIVLGDVLPDVSRRHPVRDEAIVWTSGNRVFGCDSPRVLLMVVDALADDADPAQEVAQRVRRPLTDGEAANVATTADQLRWLGRTEGRELAAAGWTHEVVRSMQTAS